MLRSHKRLRYLGKTQGPGELPYPQGLTADAEYHKTRPRRRRSPILNTTDRGRTPTVAGRYSPRPGPNTIHQYDPTRKDTKKIMANANSTYSEPPTKVMAKAPRRAPPPTMMQAMVTIAAILLVNNTGVPSSKLLNRPSHILYNVLPRRARSTKRPGRKGAGWRNLLTTLLRGRKAAGAESSGSSSTWSCLAITWRSTRRWVSPLLLAPAGRGRAGRGRGSGGSGFPRGRLLASLSGVRSLSGGNRSLGGTPGVPPKLRSPRQSEQTRQRGRPSS